MDYDLLIANINEIRFDIKKRTETINTFSYQNMYASESATLNSVHFLLIRCLEQIQIFLEGHAEKNRPMSVNIETTEEEDCD